MVAGNALATRQVSFAECSVVIDQELLDYSNCCSEYKITVGQRPISGQLTKLTAQNVTWSVLPSEQVSSLSLLPRETDRSFMGKVWICTCTGVYQTHGAKSVDVASRTRD